jgi:hypothetical protein
LSQFLTSRRFGVRSYQGDYGAGPVR